MHRTCPHCGVELSIKNEEVTGAWAFAQCFECNGTCVIVGKKEAPTVSKSPPRVVLPPPPPHVNRTHDRSNSSKRPNHPNQMSGTKWILPIGLFAIGFGMIAYKNLQIISPPVRLASTEVSVVDAATVREPRIEKVADPIVTTDRDTHETHPEVRINRDSAILRAGPGQNFRKVALARSELRMIVRGSQENWLEVEPVANPLSPGSAAIKIGQKTAWIRRDLVSPIPPNEVKIK